MFNLILFVMEILWIILAAVGGFILGFCLARRASKVQCKCHHSDVLMQKVDDLLRLSEDLELIEQLQYEKACKEELMGEIQLMFLSGQFKNFEEVLERFRAKVCCLAVGNEEERKIAEMCRELVEKCEAIVEREK